MVLRNVQPTFTFEEQRVEINELAADVDSINAGYNNTNWDTAYSWGDHATENYIVNGTFSNVTINAGITTRNLTITDDGSASPIFVSKADDTSVWNLSLQNDGYSTNAGTGTKYFMASDGTAKWYHYGYSAFENTEFYTARVTGSPSSYLALRLDTSGGAQLMYQGSYRAGSTSWGLNVTGNLYASQGMDIPDGYAFHAGNSDDLRLGHNATSSYIDNYTGALDITNYADDSDITLRTDSGSGGIATYIRCDGSNGEVQLGHYGNTKLKTTSTGVTVTGNLIADGLTLYDDEKLLFGNNNDLEIFHDQTNNIIQSDTGNLEINSGNSAGNVEINLDNNIAGGTKQSSAKFIKNAAVELYYNDTLKFETTATGVEVSGTVVSDPTATNVAGYAYEVKNGATSLGGLYKTTSNGGFLQLNNGSGTLKASINGEDGSAAFDGNTTIGSPDVSNASTGGVQVFASGQLRIQRDSAGTASDKRFQMYYGTTETASITAGGGATFAGDLTVNTASGGDATLELRMGTAGGGANKSCISWQNSAGSEIFKTRFDNSDTTYRISSDTFGDILTLARASGNATFASDVNVATAVIAGSSSYVSAPIQGVNNKLDRSSVLAINHNVGGPVFEGRRGDTNVTTTVIKADGSAEFAGTLTLTGQTATSATGASATSDAFDHYEEGTWTPGAGSNFSGAFTNAEGYYTRVGNIVFVSFQFNYPGLTDGTVSSQVTGLPFDAIDRHSGTGVEATGCVYDNDKMHLVWAEGGQGSMYVATGRPLEGSTSTSGGFIRGSFTYPVAS